MKPEDLVGRRIRFLPKGRRNGEYTIHAMKPGTESVVTKCVGESDGAVHLHFKRVDNAEYQIVRHNVDFEVIDDGGIPYSWRV